MGQHDDTRTRSLEEVRTEEPIEDRTHCVMEESHKSHSRSPMEEVDLGCSTAGTTSLEQPKTAQTLEAEAAPVVEASCAAESDGLPQSVASPAVLVDGMVATNPDIERALQDETHREKFELFISELKLNEEDSEVPRSPSTQTVAGGRGKLPIRQVREGTCLPSSSGLSACDWREGWIARSIRPRCSAVA